MPTTEILAVSGTEADEAISDQPLRIRTDTEEIKDELRQMRTELGEVLQRVRSLPTGKEWVSKQ